MYMINTRYYVVMENVNMNKLNKEDFYFLEGCRYSLNMLKENKDAQKNLLNELNKKSGYIFNIQSDFNITYMKKI